MAKSKPCNEMTFKKNYVNRRVEIENVAVLEQLNRRETFLKYWCFGGVVATATMFSKLHINYDH